MNWLDCHDLSTRHWYCFVKNLIQRIHHVLFLGSLYISPLYQGISMEAYNGKIQTNANKPIVILLFWRQKFYTKISHIREAINWGHFHKFQFHKMMKGTCVLELTRKTVRNCVKKELSAIINKITPQGTTIFFNSLKAKRCCTYLVNILFFSNKKYYPLTAVGTNLR